MNTCDDVDALITPYVDGELAPADRQIVADHLSACLRCRNRIEAEATARHVLRAHAAVSRTMGEEPAWRPRAYRLGRPAAVLPHPALIASATAVVIVAAWLTLRPAPGVTRPAVDERNVSHADIVRAITTVGTIGDGFCGPKHLYTSPNNDRRSCTLNCVTLGAGFVVVADAGVYSIANQEFPDLAAFADRRVSVRGTLQHKAITISSIVDAAD